MKPIDRSPVVPPAPAGLEVGSDVSQKETRATGADPSCPPLPPRCQAVGDGGGLPVAILDRELRDAVAVLEAVAAAPLPQQPEGLVAIYAQLGGAIATAEACLLSALDALDPHSGGGVAQSAPAYAGLRARAFALLRDAGAQFARIEPAFAAIVHGPAGWPNQPIEVLADRGDGRPLYHYRNTYKKPPGLTAEQRLAEHEERVGNFYKKGGRFEDLIVAAAGTFDRLTPQLRYDYVLATDGTLRLAPNGPEGVVKPGHSMLATGGPEPRDVPALLAGELWVLKDSAGDVEAVILANNSGHFKPSYEDLANALPYLEQLGVPREKVVLFGGPNNLPSMFEEIEENCGLEEVATALPSSPAQRLSEMGGVGRAVRPLDLLTQGE